MFDIFIRTILIAFSGAVHGSLICRSIYRKPQPVPTISTRWVDSCTTYQLSHQQLEQAPLFEQYDEQYFNEHLLPDTPLTFRNNKKQSVPGARLKLMIEELVKSWSIKM